MSIATLLRPSESSDDLSHLTQVSEQFARSLQDLLSRRAKVEVRAGPISQARYSEWRIAQNPFGMLVRYTLGKHGGELVLHIPGYLVSQMVDIEYGGKGQVSARGAFSPIETHFVERLAGHLLPQVHLTTEGAVTQLCHLAETQSDILAFNWPRSCDQIVMAAIFVECPAIKSATISCFTDITTANQIGRCSSDSDTAKPATDPKWQEKMRSATMRVRLPARAVLTRTELPAAQLLTLSPGDILPVLMPAQVPLIVAGHHFARGSIGESNGRIALKIEHIEGMDHE